MPTVLSDCVDKPPNTIGGMVIAKFLRITQERQNFGSCEIHAGIDIESTNTRSSFGRVVIGRVRCNFYNYRITGRN